MLEDALAYPRRSDDWVATILIGGVLMLLSFLVLPGLVVQGYLLRVLRRVATGDVEAAPSFTEWGELLVDGIRLFVVGIAYSLVVVVPMVVLAAVTSGLAAASPRAAGPVVVVLILASLVLSFVLAYFLPAAITNFAVEDSIGGAFAFGTITDAAISSEYATAWVLALVVGVVGGLVAAALSVVVVGLFVSFYVQVATYFLFARGYARGLGRDEGDAGGEDDAGDEDDDSSDFEFDVA